MDVEAGFALVNEIGSLFLVHLSDNSISGLRLVVASGVFSEVTSDNLLGKRARLFSVQQGSRYVEILFPTYVLHMTINESHGLSDRNMPRHGKRLLQHTDSYLLAHASNISAPYDIHGERPLKHFELLTENHLMNVLTYDDHEVREISEPPAINVQGAQIWYRESE